MQGGSLRCMANRKKFKWTEESYTMREFIDHFSHNLPVVIIIVVGWMGRDEEHEFGGDQIYRISAVKRQSRVVTQHSSGYYVSIPTKTTKNVDIFFSDGKERHSATVEDVVNAFQANTTRCVSMRFENDEKLSFTYGPDNGDEINFGKMKVIDVYEERYLVAHSIIDGKVHAPRAPCAVPVYMDIDVAPAVSLVDGTKEDFYKVLADLEDQMANAVTDVNVYDEIMLFPEYIQNSDYEVINPMATISRATTWKIPAEEMTSSPAYSKYPAIRKGPNVRQKAPHGRYNHAPPSVTRVGQSPLGSGSHPSSRRTDAGPVTRRIDARPLIRRVDEGRETRRVDGVSHATAPPTAKPQLTVLPRRVTSTAGMHGQSQLPRMRTDYASNYAVKKDTWERIPSRRRVVSMIPGNSPVAAVNSNVSREYHRHLKSSTVPSSSPRLEEFHTFDDVPSDVTLLNSKQLASCLRLLKFPEDYVNAFLKEDVDGELLMSIDESILRDEFNFRKFEAIKLMKFAMHGYRPKYM